jgi:hypothetical protein
MAIERENGMIINKLNEECGKEIREVYEQTLNNVLPFIKKRSRYVSNVIPNIDYDDALQEGRLAVVVALAKCNREKYDDIIPYVVKIIKNAYRRMVYEALTQTKIPHVNVIDEEGNINKKPCHPISLDVMMESKDGNVINYSNGIEDTKGLSPEQIVINNGISSELGKFTMKLYNKLSGVDYDVFKCKVHPPHDFLDMMFMDGVDFVYRTEKGELRLAENFSVPVEYISKYLNIDRNAVGWSLYKIRKMFLEMARNDEDFSELFEDLIIDRRWPQVLWKATSNEDLEFKRMIFKKHALNTIQIKEYDYSISRRKDGIGNPYYSRLVKWYTWGCTITIKRDRTYYTIVAIGRFNIRTGAVFGSNDSQVHLPMKWYKSMAKELVDG